MKWKKMIWATVAVALLLAMGLTGCANPAGGGGGDDGPPLQVGDGKTPLSTPTGLSIIEDTFTLEWDSVEGAVAYKISVDDKDTLAWRTQENETTFFLGIDTSLALSLEPKSHRVKVQAVAASSNPDYRDSAYSNPFPFETASCVFETDGNGTITGLTTYGKTLEKIVIPEKIGNEPITEIANEAFKDNATLQEVHIPKTVTSIGNEAFKGNTNLHTVHFHRNHLNAENETGTTLGNDVFKDCNNLDNVHVPVESAEHYALLHSGKYGAEIKTPDVIGVELDKATLAIKVGDAPSALTVNVLVRDGATNPNKKVTWTTSNGNVVTVVDGVVTAVGPGTATITVTTADGGKTATCVVTVTQPVTGIELDQTTFTIYVGDTPVTLKATVLPKDAWGSIATNQKVTWESTDNTVAKVDQTGKVTAVSAGTAIITVTTEDGGFAKNCTVTVLQHVASVSLEPKTLSIYVGDAPVALVATVAPENADNKSVMWSSSNTAVATVDSDGFVAAIKAGTATITATTVDNGKTATCAVTVLQHVVGVELNQASFVMTAGDKVTLTATVLPTDATNKNVTWASSNTAVATVANGIVTAVAKGTATITVTTADGGETATCNFTINPQTGTVNVTHYLVTEADVTATYGSTTLISGNTLRITPAAGYTPVMWSVNGNSEQVGGANFTFDTKDRANGRYTVTLIAEKGGRYFSVDIIVTVTIPVTGVTLNESALSLVKGITSTATLVATVNPVGALNKNVTWEITGNDTVATVDQTGKVTAVSTGSAIITARSEADPTKFATCTVTVTEPGTVNGITYRVLSEAEMANPTLIGLLDLGNNDTLSISPAGGYTAERWTVNGTTEQVGGQNFVFEAENRSSGNYTVTLVAVKDGKYYNVNVYLTVTVTVAEVLLSQSELAMTAGVTPPVTLRATVLPATAANTSVDWVSDNLDVATVVNGVVTAKNVGTANITATAGGISATCEVTVTLPGTVNGITYYWLNATDITAETTGATTLIKGNDETLVITCDEGFTPERWSVNGQSAQIGGSSFAFSSEDKVVGQYTVSLMASQNGRYYSTNVTVTVKE